MSTLLFHHPVCAEHNTGRGHPERPERLHAVLSALQAPEFAELALREAPPASHEQVALAHPLAHVERLLAIIPEDGLVALDGDTIISPRSGEAALRAVGAVCAAVDAVLDGTADNAFCAVRPPGHHAEPQTAMGFCLFNNIAVGALHAQARHGLGRVAVVDFDVHHGNGTQAIFWDRADCQLLSSHQAPLFPGTGSPAERGAHDNIVNLPLRPGSGSAEIRAAWRELFKPALQAFRPEMIFISAGFDAHADDPLASLRFVEDDYAWLTREILAVAADCCQGRVVSSLEGGYNLAALAACAAAHVRELRAA